jgi:non-specific serine/threonine protein kinase
VENQATDRAFRIGQKHNVLVHKFITTGTVEEKIDAMITEKQKMADEILSSGKEVNLTELPDDEILRLVSLDVTRAKL